MLQQELADQQGAIKTSLFSYLLIMDANWKRDKELELHNGAMVTGSDDTCLMGIKEHVFGSLRHHENTYSEVNLKYNLNNRNRYTQDINRDTEFHNLQAYVEEGDIWLVKGDSMSKVRDFFLITLVDNTEKESLYKIVQKNF